MSGTVYLKKFNVDTGKIKSIKELSFLFCSGEVEKKDRNFIVMDDDKQGEEIVIPLSVVLDEVKRVMLEPKGCV